MTPTEPAVGATPTAADGARSGRLSVERVAGGNRINALIVIDLMLFALGLIGRLTWNIEPRRNETPVDRQADEQMGQVMRMCSWMFWPGLVITSAGAVVALAQ